MKSRLPWGMASAPEIAEADVIILGVPFDGAVSNERGAAAAPDRFRELSRILPLATEEGVFFQNLKIRDEGNIEPHLDWEQYFKEVQKKAFDLLTQDKFCLFLGGDHSVGIPLESAFSRAHTGENIGIIHFDAHCDLADEYDGHRWSHACTRRRGFELTNVKPKNVTLVGIRSYMDDELEFLEKNPVIRVINAREIYKSGVDYTLKVIKDRYPDCTNIFLSLDIDVLDPAYAPGTGTPESGGLSTRELMELVKGIMVHLPVKAVNVVEVAPPLDSSDITSWAALKVMYEIFGEVHKKRQ